MKKNFLTRGILLGSVVYSASSAPILADIIDNAGNTQSTDATISVEDAKLDSQVDDALEGSVDDKLSEEPSCSWSNIKWLDPQMEKPFEFGLEIASMTVFSLERNNGQRKLEANSLKSRNEITDPSQLNFFTSVELTATKEFFLLIPSKFHFAIAKPFNEKTLEFSRYSIETDWYKVGYTHGNFCTYIPADCRYYAHQVSFTHKFNNGFKYTIAVEELIKGETKADSEDAKFVKAHVLSYDRESMPKNEEPLFDLEKYNSLPNDAKNVYSSRYKKDIAEYREKIEKETKEQLKEVLTTESEKSKKHRSWKGGILPNVAFVVGTAYEQAWGNIKLEGIFAMPSYYYGEAFNGEMRDPKSEIVPMWGVVGSAKYVIVHGEEYHKKERTNVSVSAKYKTGLGAYHTGAGGIPDDTLNRNCYIVADSTLLPVQTLDFTLSSKHFHIKSLFTYIDSNFLYVVNAKDNVLVKPENRYHDAMFVKIVPLGIQIGGGNFYIEPSYKIVFSNVFGVDDAKFNFGQQIGLAVVFAM